MKSKISICDIGPRFIIRAINVKLEVKSKRNTEVISPICVYVKTPPCTRIICLNHSPHEARVRCGNQITLNEMLQSKHDVVCVFCPQSWISSFTSF